MRKILFTVLTLLITATSWAQETAEIGMADAMRESAALQWPEALTPILAEFWEDRPTVLWSRRFQSGVKSWNIIMSGHALWKLRNAAREWRVGMTRFQTSDLIRAPRMDAQQKISDLVGKGLPLLNPNIREWTESNLISPYEIRWATDPDGKEHKEFWLVTDK